MKCFYHSADLDGHCSGAIVKYFHPDCEMIGINYGGNFPWDTINHNEDIWLVDFCLQPFEDMIRLSSISSLVWIDHHKTSLEEAERRGFIASRAQRLDMDEAGCEMTWRYVVGVPIPRAVYYLGRYDIWKHQEVVNCLEFQYGMRFEEDTRPENVGLWSPLFFDNMLMVDRIIETGRTILTHEQRQNTKYAKECAFEMVFANHRCIAINRGLTNSLLFDSVYQPDHHDMMVSFYSKGKHWTVSLYSTKPEIDCSAVAKAFGGGGHRGAAGFQCKVLPWD